MDERKENLEDENDREAPDRTDLETAHKRLDEALKIIEPFTKKQDEFKEITHQEWESHY